MSDTPRTDADIFIANGGQKVATLLLTKQMEAELAVARKGLEAVASLMDESHGVDGLHLNGDLAPWDELRTGGRFEEWLVAFDDALNAARSSNPTGQGRSDCGAYPGPGCSVSESKGNA